MKAAFRDLCFLYFPKSVPGNIQQNAEKEVARGITCIQTDDTINAGNPTHQKAEELYSEKFKRKDAQHLRMGETIEFNGAKIRLLEGNVYSVTISQHVQRLGKCCDTASYVAERARGSYIAAICRPDLAVAFGKAAQVAEPQETDFKRLNKLIDRTKASVDLGLKYVPLDPTTVRIATFVDGSFADNLDLTSQLGFVMTLMDKDDKANIIHYASTKSKRVVRSVLAAELYALAIGYDNGVSIKPTMTNILGRNVALVLYTDSRSLYDALTTLNPTTEKRLLIDLAVVRQAYERREISEVCWIPTEQNPADGLTKEKPNRALETLMKENRLRLTPNAWIDRDGTQSGSQSPTKKKRRQCRRNWAVTKMGNMSKDVQHILWMGQRGKGFIRLERIYPCREIVV